MEHGSVYDDDLYTDGYGFNGGDSQAGFFSRLTGRGSVMASLVADSWFGLGAHEEQAVEGPSILERHLTDDLDPFSHLGLGFAPVESQALPLWDIDLGFPSGPAPSAPAPVPHRSTQEYLSQDFTNDDTYMAEEGLLSFEMEFLPPVPDRPSEGMPNH
jgi:hypothetical protein